MNSLNEQRSKTGFVVGKFLPPHRGHRHLIETARSAVDHLTVMLCEHPGDPIPGYLRHQWLREMHPDSTILLIDEDIDANDSYGWAVYVREKLGYVPDLVFTSEDYGERFSGFLGSRHVLVDKARLSFPVSGTAVRADPFAQWRYLDACVRMYYLKRVCVVGAESSGTTTLTQALAEHYRTSWVPEYGREYSELVLNGALTRDWTSEEFTHIAHIQCEREDAAARQANCILFCDTAAFATSIWHERYMGHMSPHVDAVAASRSYDLIILTDVDIPFVQDGIRDGEHIRAAMHERFREYLSTQSIPWITVSGAHEQRMDAAVKAIGNPGNPLPKSLPSSRGRALLPQGEGL